MENADEDVGRISVEITETCVPQTAPKERGAATHEEAPAIARLGRYELLGRMEVGGMAEIFLARERSAHGGSRRVVVKVMRPELGAEPALRAMFLQEGQVSLRLQHPSICHVYEHGLELGRAFIAMEYVHGVTLRALLRRAARTQRRVPPPILVRIAADVASALSAAHRALDPAGQPLGLVHRDVSPQNVMIGFDGVVKLLDFGVARADSTCALEEAGTVAGKVGYLAPEQWLGRVVDARVDVFALGVCLWEGLTGRRLYGRRREPAAVLAQVMNGAPDPNAAGAGVPEQLSRIVRRALAREPEDRFQSAAELQHALEWFLADQRELVNADRVARFVCGLHREEALGDPPVDRRPELVAWTRLPERPRRALFRGPIVMGMAALALAGAFVAVLLREAPAEEPPLDRPRAPLASRAPPSPSEVREETKPSPNTPLAAPAAQSSPVEVPAPAEANEEGSRASSRAPRRRPPPVPGGFIEDPGF